MYLAPIIATNRPGLTLPLTVKHDQSFLIQTYLSRSPGKSSPQSIISTSCFNLNNKNYCKCLLLYMLIYFILLG